mmetsp:Transcript_38219/g.92191  ORF Transcript_38219/g.92191 Transcript_38219/m.92191 type:complete len:343 (-) Transcript_38219:165-1193(-)
MVCVTPPLFPPLTGTVVDVGGFISIVTYLGTATCRCRPYSGASFELTKRATRTECCLFHASGLVHAKSTERPPWEKPRTLVSEGAGPPTATDGGAGTVGAGTADGGAAGGDAPNGSLALIVGAIIAVGAGWANKSAPMGAAAGAAATTAGWANISNPPPVGAATGAAAIAGGAEKMSDRRSTSLCPPAATGFGSAFADTLPFCAAAGGGGAGAAPPPPKMSSRSNRPSSPAEAAGAGAAAMASPPPLSPSNMSIILSPSVMALLLSSSASSSRRPIFSVLATLFPLPPLPKMSSSSPALPFEDASFNGSPLMSALYSHDRSRAIHCASSSVPRASSVWERRR